MPPGRNRPEPCYIFLLDKSVKMIVFLIVSLVIGMFMAIIWKSSDWVNALLKTIWLLYTAYAFVMLLQAIFLGGVAPTAHLL
jgi:ABC-type proline/glycine betaine transport system permease subunit